MIDLHLHSMASDGTLTPTEIVKLAHKLNLKAIALTDHDSVEGLPFALKEGNHLGIEVVPAVELSSDFEGRDVHLLGYYVDYKEAWFKEHLKQLKEARFQRAVKMIEKLKEAGLMIAFKDVLEEAGDGAVGRAHIARVMIKQGYIDDIEEAFEKYIGRKALCYVEKYSFQPEEVIEVIRKANGIAILAHPGLSEVDESIGKYIKHGLQGLEAYHSNHTKQMTAKYLKLAEHYGLITTGGSDCHGLKSGRGLTIGSVNVPDIILDDLKRLKGDRFA